MDVGSIKTWHCMLVALVLGFSVAMGRQWAVGPSDPANIPGDLSAQQFRFETAVLGQLEGNPLATNITVTPRWLRGRDGKNHPFHVVTADVSSGAAEKTAAGRQLHLRPAMFLMPVPYQPRVALESLRSPALPDPAGEFSRASVPTVLDFLRLARISRGTDYSYAWWDAHPMLTWVGGSVLTIGMLLPATVNLMVFGSLRRPREEKAASLRGVTGSTSAPQPVAVDDASLEQMIEAMEPAAEPAVPTANEQKSAKQTPRPLSHVPAAPAPAASNVETKAFGITDKDYYPTELKGRSHHED
ncbi:MAG: hypothetical protein JWN24_1291 [Phycisphaerales bacterium]|nr:hypothetical protein [Phycisphaerales bacterium]